MKTVLIIICIALFSCGSKKIDYYGGLKGGDTIFVKEPILHYDSVVKIWENKACDTVFIHDTIVIPNGQYNQVQ